MPPATVMGHRPAHIDPRIRARRIEVARGVGRRRLQRLVDVGVVLVVGLGFVGALRTPLLDVDEVQVRGNAHTPAALVAERSGIHPGDQLVDIDLRAAGERVAELPWVDQVRLDRGIDGQITLEVTERVPVAVAGEGTTGVLVDADGRALALVSDEPALAATLVRVAIGTEGLQPGQFLAGDPSGTLSLAARLAAAGVTNGMALSAPGPDGLQGTLADGIEVRFGAPDQLDAKVRSLVTVLEQVDLACASVIDVRSPGSPVLTREEGCS